MIFSLYLPEQLSFIVITIKQVSHDASFWIPQAFPFNISIWLGLSIAWTSRPVLVLTCHSKQLIGYFDPFIPNTVYSYSIKQKTDVGALQSASLIFFICRN